MITPKIRRRIKHELSKENPTVRIGKEGTTQQVMNETSIQLDKREMVKVKILKSALKDQEAGSIASKISKQTSSTLIEVRGHTFILYKKRKGAK